MYEVALIFSVACFVVACTIFAKSRAFSAFHPLAFYLAFHGIAFVFRPMLAWINDYNLIYSIYQFSPSYEDKITALMVSNLGLIAFLFACLRTGNVPMRFRQDRLSLAERKTLTAPFILACAICAPVGVYALSKMFGTAVETGSAYTGLIRDGAKQVVYNEGISGYLIEAPTVLATCAAVLVWLFRFHIYALIPLAGFIAFRAGTGTRGAIVATLVSLVLFYLYDQRRRFPSLKLLILAPVLLVAFTEVGNDRGASIRRLLANDMSSEIFAPVRTGERFMEGMDFANLEYLEYVIYVVPQRSGTYGYFNDILQIFTEPVPRSLWPEKPIGAPFQRINFFDYGRPVGVTISLPGEGWYSLGWLGVVIWCGLVGAVLGAIYRRFVRSSQSAFQVAAYVMFVPILIVAFRDGQAVTVFRNGLFFMLPIVVWWRFSRWIGIPSLESVRRFAARGPAARVPEAPSSWQDGDLPPAVVRRRKALAMREPPKQS